VRIFRDWLQNTFFDIAMVDYPYPASFLEPLPAWPINETCKHLATKQEDEHQVGLHMTTSFTQSHCLYPAATSGPGLCPGSVLQLFWGDTVPQHLKASHSQPWRPGVEFSGMCSVTGPIYPSY